MITSWPWWLWLVIGLLVGFIFGTIIVDMKKHDGVIHITREENTDKYLFEFNIPPEKIPQMKNVIFAVKLEPLQRQQDLQSI